MAHLQMGEFAPELAPSYRPNDYDAQFKFGIGEKEKALNAMKKLNLHYPISSGTEDAVVITGYLNQQLNLPGNGTTTSELLRNKEKLYQVLKDHGLFKAPFVGVSSVEEGLTKYPSLGIDFPLVVKPVDDAGGRGFSKVNNEKELDAALSSLFSNKTMFGDKIDRVIIQAFLSGPHFAVQGAALNGKFIFSDVIDYQKRLAVYELDSLANPNDQITKERIHFVEKNLEAVNFLQQMFHIEGIADPVYGMNIIDFAGRPMGGVDHLMVEACTGYNQLDAYVDSLLTPHKFLAFSQAKKQSGEYYTKLKSGYVVDLILYLVGEVAEDPDIEFIKNLPTYLGHKIGKKKGDIISAVTSNMLESGGAVWLGGSDDQLELDRLAIRQHEKDNLLIPIKAVNFCEKAVAGHK